MREILFRGKTLTGRWVEGSYYKQEEFYGSKEDADVIITSKENLTYDQALGFAVVLPETVGQYTGLTDKNGKKIFEGDIVKIDDKYIRYVAYSGVLTGFVKLHYISRCVSEGSTMLGYGYDSYKHTIEVIGNIHDNPELLEGGE